MRRLLLGISVLAFLAFVGVQAVHVHQGADHRDCQICVLGAQASRHMPTVVPALAPVLSSVGLSAVPAAKALERHRQEDRARSPPSLSATA